MLHFMNENHADVLKMIRHTRDFGDDAKKATVAALEAFAKQFA
jgi:F-type H+-transporting ATPase subunit alpha